MKDRKLWFEDKTGEDIAKVSDLDSDSVIYNLHEDCLCLNESNKQLQKENDELRAHIERLREVLDSVIKKCVVYGKSCVDGYAEIQDIAVDIYNETQAQSLNHILSQVEEETIWRCMKAIRDEESLYSYVDTEDVLINMPRKYKEQSNED